MLTQLYEVPIGGYFYFTQDATNTLYWKTRMSGSTIYYRSEGEEEQATWGWEFVHLVTR